MDTIVIVDTSICTDNLGDEIIMDAVNDVVQDLFPDAYCFRVPSHEALSDRTRRFIRNSSFCFIGGTNLLSSHLPSLGLWRVRPIDADVFASTHTVCLGTGWNDYMSAATRETRRFLGTALSSNLVHAARDGYTRDHLNQAGIRAVTTSCPTTWRLTPSHCTTIPSRAAKSVVFTLSAWRRAVDDDVAFIKVLKRNYANIYFFPQMQDDFAYFQSFGIDEIKVVTPTTEGYTKFLENEDVDFIGTRLHGGIRALQKGRRALILAIDNRAAEIAKDTSLPVVPRSSTNEIEAWIHNDAATELKLPQAAIDTWKKQFSRDNVAKLPEIAKVEIRETYPISNYVKRIVKYATR